MKKKKTWWWEVWLILSSKIKTSWFLSSYVCFNSLYFSALFKNFDNSNFILDKFFSCSSNCFLVSFTFCNFNNTEEDEDLEPPKFKLNRYIHE